MGRSVDIINENKSKLNTMLDRWHWQ